MKKYDLYGLGNALVDMEFSIDDSFLARHGIAKGHMTLVDEARLLSLVESLNGYEPKKSSGGSAANTLIAAQNFGIRTFYSCKVARDETGAYFIRDLNRSGIETNPHHQSRDGTSGRCLVLITTDAERSMNTCLGISETLGIEELNEAALLESRCLYIEGYLSSSPSARAAAVRCRELAESNGIRTSLTLSDPSMVEIFRAGLEEMLGNGVDQLFCNEEEALGWAKTDRMDIAISELSDISPNLNITMGTRGSLCVDKGSVTEIPAFAVEAIDSNGAGDIFAGACLYGWASGMNPEQAAAFANYAASRLVTHFGPRFPTPEAYQLLLSTFPSAAH